MRAADLIARYYAAFNARDWQGMLNRLTDDVRHDVNEGGQREGKKKFAEFLKHMDKCYDEQLRDLVVMADCDNLRSSAEFIVHGKYKATDEGMPEAKGQTYVLPAGAFFEIRDGLIARVTTYYNLQNWLKQIS